MGMYDTIRGLTVYCPKCGALIENDFQTKSLECNLNTYHPGDEVQTNLCLDPEQDWIEIYSTCNHCVSGNCCYLVRVDASVVDGVLTGELV